MGGAWKRGGAVGTTTAGWLPQGEAFADVRRGMPGAAYFCGVSLSYGGEVPPGG